MPADLYCEADQKYFPKHCITKGTAHAAMVTARATEGGVEKKTERKYIWLKGWRLVPHCRAQPKGTSTLPSVADLGTQTCPSGETLIKENSRNCVAKPE